MTASKSAPNPLAETTGDSAQAPSSASSSSVARETQVEESDLSDEILSYLPALRAYGRSLTKDANEADDLLQETLLKALANTHRFQRGTNLRAWLFTIERNTFYSDYRRRKRESPGEADPENMLETGANQEWSMKMEAVKGALSQLPNDQRDALVLVGGLGLSYEEAAEICGCPLGTIKSRVNRGRAGLLKLLDVESQEDYLRG